MIQGAVLGEDLGFCSVSQSSLPIAFLGNPGCFPKGHGEVGQEFAITGLSNCPFMYCRQSTLNPSWEEIKQIRFKKCFSQEKLFVFFFNLATLCLLKLGYLGVLKSNFLLRKEQKLTQTWSQCNLPNIPIDNRGSCPKIVSFIVWHFFLGSSARVNLSSVYMTASWHRRIPIWNWHASFSSTVLSEQDHR